LGNEKLACSNICKSFKRNALHETVSTTHERVQTADQLAMLMEDRRNDDTQIQRLNNLCEQQNKQLKKLVKEKESIQQHFDEYKTFQEESLAEIKADMMTWHEVQEDT
jgi:predicted  nucleic acid-binding Zn-ribbon protein